MIVIVGAGIAGLSLAYELSHRGNKVTVLEANTIASGASGVATSYLEPRLGTTPARAIEHEAMRRWEDYAADLETVSGFSVGFRRAGQIRVALAENLAKFEASARMASVGAREPPFSVYELGSPASTLILSLPLLT